MDLLNPRPTSIQALNAPVLGGVVLVLVLDHKTLGDPQEQEWVESFRQDWHAIRYNATNTGRITIKINSAFVDLPK